MLPKYYKFRAYNDAGVSVTVAVDWMPYQVVSGAATYAAIATPIASGAIASAGNSLSSAIDNSAAKNVGGTLMATATPGTTPAGNKQLILYLLPSLDNTTFEDAYSAAGEGYGSIVFFMSLAGTGAQHQSFEVPA